MEPGRPPEQPIRVNNYLVRVRSCTPLAPPCPVIRLGAVKDWNTDTREDCIPQDTAGGMRGVFLAVICAALASADTYRIAVFYPDNTSTPPDLYGNVIHEAADFVQWWVNGKNYSTAFADSGQPVIFQNDTLEIDHYGMGGLKEDPTKMLEAAENATNYRCGGDLANLTACPAALAFVGGNYVLDVKMLATFAASRRVLMTHPWTQDPSYAYQTPEKDVLDTMYRVYPSSATDAQYMASFIKLQGWDHCSIISDGTKEDSDLWTAEFLAEAERMNLTIASQGVLSPTQVISTTQPSILDATELLNQIKRTAYHVIVVNAYQHNVVPLLVQAKALGMIGNNYVWIGSQHWTLTTNIFESDPSYYDLVDGAIGIAPNAVRSAVPGSPIEPCATMATDPNYSAFAAYLASATNSLSCLYFLQLIESSTPSSGYSYVPRSDSTYMYTTLLTFDAVFSAAKAVSDVVDVLNECRASGNTLPDAATCARISTTTGMRQEIVTTYNNTDYLGFTGSMRPTGLRETSRPYLLHNLRKSLFEAKAADPNNPALLTNAVTGQVSKDGYTSYGDPIQYHGGSTTRPPNRVPSADEKKNYIAQWCRNLGFFLVSLLFASAVACLIWTFCNSRLPVVRAAQPMFLYQIVLGCIVSTSCLIPAGVDDRDSSDSGVTAACNLELWLYGLGFAITYTALLAKIWKIKTVLLQACRDLKVVVVTPFQIYGLMCAGLLVEIIILSSWTGAEGFTWRRECTEVDFWGQCVESRGECRASRVWSVLGLLIALHLAAMFYALILCYQCRDVPTEFAETKWITTAMVSNFQIFVLGVLLLNLLGKNSTLFYLVKVFCVVLSDGSVLAVMFLPKLYTTYFSHLRDRKTEKTLRGMAEKIISRNEVELKTRGQSSRQVDDSKRGNAPPSSGSYTAASISVNPNSVSVSTNGRPQPRV